MGRSLFHLNRNAFRIFTPGIPLPRKSKTAFLLIILGNRITWTRGIVNGMRHFLGIGRAGRAGIARIVVIDLDELWTFIPE